MKHLMTLNSILIHIQDIDKISIQAIPKNEHDTGLVFNGIKSDFHPTKDILKKKVSLIRAYKDHIIILLAEVV